MRSRYGRGTVEVRSRCGQGVRSRYSRGAVEVRSRYGRGTVEVRSRYRRGTVEVQSRCVRYSLGTLPVCSWYGILKVRSRLVFSMCVEPGTRTVRFIVRIAQSRLAGFGSAIDTIPLIRNYSSYGLADSDRDNKLSVIRYPLGRLPRSWKKVSVRASP